MAEALDPDIRPQESAPFRLGGRQGGGDSRHVSRENENLRDLSEFYEFVRALRNRVLELEDRIITLEGGP